MKYIIITNNPYVESHKFEGPLAQQIEVVFKQAAAMGVLIAARTMVAKGGVLKSDPKGGIHLEAVRPGAKGKDVNPFAFNPYISVVVTPQDAVDFASVKRLEEAIALFRKYGQTRFFSYTDDTVARFQMADSMLLQETIFKLLQGIKV